MYQVDLLVAISAVLLALPTACKAKQSRSFRAYSSTAIRDASVKSESPTGVLPLLSNPIAHESIDTSHEGWLVANGQRSGCSGASFPDFFFHSGAFAASLPTVDEFTRSWFSRSLSQMGEPSLSCRKSSGVAFRILKLPGWGSASTVRIDSSQIVVKELGQNGPEGSNHLLTFAQRTVFKAELIAVTAAIEKMDFWSIPSVDVERQVSIRDGVQWVFEARSATRYHVVTRPCGYRTPRNLPDSERLSDLVDLVFHLGEGSSHSRTR